MIEENPDVFPLDPGDVERPEPFEPIPLKKEVVGSPVEKADVADCPCSDCAGPQPGYDGDEDDLNPPVDPPTFNPGRVTQYSLYGGGFLPTQETIGELPAGVYELQHAQGRWFFKARTISKDKLLVLPDSRSEEVVNEIERFWNLKDRFKKYGLVHKRGFLLWGPPGSGKTCTVTLVMDKLVKKGGIAILCSEPGVTSMLLASLREIEPERPVTVVLEDIDAIIEKNDESAVLNLLDGEKSISNVVFLATTNYPEKLDGRVTNRPSRFDRVVKIGMPNDAARRIYLESRQLDLSPEEIGRWVEASKGFSIAHIKELVVNVMCLENDFGETIERLRGMVHQPRSSDGEQKLGFGQEKNT